MDIAPQPAQRVVWSGVGFIARVRRTRSARACCHRGL
jgi:hypothetical protein